MIHGKKGKLVLNLLVLSLFFILSINNVSGLITCTKNSDCGVNHYTSQPFCENTNVVNNYQIFECRNPGTELSKCVNYTVQKVNEICNYKCLNGECVNKNQICIINSDCGTDTPLGEQTCNNGQILQDKLVYKCDTYGDKIEISESDNFYPNGDGNPYGIVFVANKNFTLAFVEKYNSLDGESSTKIYLKDNNDNILKTGIFDGSIADINYYLIEGKKYKLVLSADKNHITQKYKNSIVGKNLDMINITGEVYQGGGIKSITWYNQDNKITFCSNFTINKEVDNCMSSPDCLDIQCIYPNINCEIDSDCGEDGFIDQPVCKNGDSYKEYKFFRCINKNYQTYITDLSNFKDNVDGNPYGIVFVANKDFTLISIEKYLGIESSSKIYLKDNNDNILNTGFFIGSIAFLNYDIKKNTKYKLVLSADNDHFTQKYKNSIVGKNLDLINITGEVYQGGGLVSINTLVNGVNGGDGICANQIVSNLINDCSSSDKCYEGKCIVCNKNIECDDLIPYTEDTCINPGTENSICQNKNICKKNSDCGIDYYYGDSFCKDNNVIKKHQIYECINPDSDNSRCINYTIEQVNKTCDDVCSNGKCYEECKNNEYCGEEGYIGEKACKNGDVYQDYITYTCNKFTKQTISEPSDFYINYDGNPYGIVFVANKDFTLSEVEKYNEGSSFIYLKDDKDNILQTGLFDNNIAKFDHYLYSGRTYKLVLSAETAFTQKYKTSFIGRNYELINITDEVYVNGGVFSITANSFGEALSTCSHSIDNKLINDCSGDDRCNNGKCIICISDSECDDLLTYTEDKCINPGTENSNCQNKNICLKNKDCGTNQYINDPFCIGNNVTKSYQIFECRNPGTGLSRCVNYTVQKVNKTCNDECLNGKCVPECKQNSDCGIDRFIGNPFCNNGDSYKTFIEFTCENPGTIESKCSNQIRLNLIEDCTEKQTCISGKCMQITCNKNSECGKNSYVGNNYCVDENVTKNYQIFECRNQGTYLSKCINYTVQKVNKTCNESCENGQCVKGVIKCYYDNDCGRDGYIGGIICKDGNIFEDYIDYTCNNKGTFRSFCSFEKKPKITQCLQKQTCLNGMCVDVICKINSDCGTDGFIGNTFIIDGITYQKYQTFICTDAGTIFSRCKSSIEDRRV
ncbi:MAG: hypothetical protein WC867_02795 [Candidatus Pacearchaeota archaeon]|jgi:hypothetical protein